MPPSSSSFTVIAEPLARPTPPTPSTPLPPPERAWNERFAQLLDVTGEGIFGVDPAGHCTFVNRAGAQMLGYRTEEVLGRDLNTLLHTSHGDGRSRSQPDQQPGPAQADDPILDALRRGLPCRIDSAQLWRADGSAFSAELASHPIIEAGELQGAVVTLVEQRVEDRSAELARALAELRELAAHQESVREQERTRIAREIHDELGSLLVALKLDLGWLDKRIDGREPLQLKCQAMGRTIDTAVANLGRIVTELRPSILDHQGLWAALEWQAQEFIDTNDVQPDMRFHVAAGVPPLTGEGAERWSIVVYRIFEQMLGNVARHARASTVSIRLYVDEPPAPVLHLELRDDGVGATPAALAHPRGHGIRGMREQAGFFGGTLNVDSVPGVGTVVRLTMPLPGAAR